MSLIRGVSVLIVSFAGLCGGRLSMFLAAHGVETWNEGNRVLATVEFLGIAPIIGVFLALGIVVAEEFLKQVDRHRRIREFVNRQG